MIEWWGPIIFEYYGSTEVGGTFVTSTDWLSHPGTVGKPGPVTKLRVLDEMDAEVPAGTVGRIFMRQGDDQIEYLHDPEKTLKSRVRDLMTVGDIGWVDDDGFLYLAGRTSEVIIVGGVNIYPAEVENVILGHGSVADVCVVGIPNEEYGEEVFAAIVLRGSDQEASETVKSELREEIEQLCSDQLSKIKCPRTIEFRSELPRDPNGKLYRKKVRDPFWESAQRSI
jgi:long-chain acyl-CoA synthetase